MWSQAPRAAKKWAHNRKTRKTDWAGAKTKRPGIGGLKSGTRKRKRRR